jgi:uncharacterized membrane protein
MIGIHAYMSVVSLEHLVSAWNYVRTRIMLISSVSVWIRLNLTSVLRVRLSPLFIITGHHYLQILLTTVAIVIIPARRVL